MQTHPGTSSLPGEALLGCLILLAAVGAADLWQFHLGNGTWGLLLYVVSAGSGLWLLHDRLARSGVQRILSRPLLWGVLISANALVDQVHFRIAQAKPNPMTTALALELPGRLLLAGREPYHCVLPAGAPVSPGPGWIMLLLPLTVPGLTGLLCMLMLAIAAAAMAGIGWLAAGLFCLLMLAQPLFQSQAANGQDLYAISLAFVLVCVLLDRFSENRKAIAAIAVFAAIVGTARMPMPLFLCVPALGLARRRRWNAVLFLAIAVFGAVLLDFTFAAWAHRAGDVFQPMHVFRRGENGAGYLSQAAVLVLGVLAVWWILNRMRGVPADWMLGTWMLMAALFTPESVKEWQQWQFYWGWEGANYLTFSLPLLAGAIALRWAAAVGARVSARHLPETGPASHGILM